MIRTLFAGLAALCLAGAAVAAPKEAAKAEKPCPAGVGKAVCCKASVANHCGYVSCCEQGNKGFFSAAHCGTCEKHTAKAQLAAKKESSGSACSAASGGYVSCCEQGNKAFFKGQACNMGAKSAKGSCCADKAKKK